MSVNNALDVEAQLTALRRVEAKLGQYVTTSVTTSEDNRETEQIIDTDHPNIIVARQCVQSAIFALENPDQFTAEPPAEPATDVSLADEEDIMVPAFEGDGFAEEPEDAGE